MNLPPFYVGQKVVATHNHSQGRFKKGDVFCIIRIEKQCCCWNVDVEITGPRITECEDCQEIFDGVWFKSTRFAPITESFQSISLEKVLEQETKLISVN